MGIVEFIRDSRRASIARCSDARRSIFDARKSEKRGSAQTRESRTSEQQRSSESRKSRPRGSLQDGTRMESWVRRMSVEEKAATFVAAVEGGAVQVEGFDEHTVVQARQRLSIMSVSEQQEVLVSILDSTTATANAPAQATRLSLGAAEDGVVPFETPLESCASLASITSRASWAARAARASLTVGDLEEDEPAPHGGEAAVGTAARRSWKRCRMGVLVAGYWQRCSAAAVLARWKATLNEEQLSRLVRLYTLQVLSSLDSLARHERYFVVVDKAATEVEKRHKTELGTASTRRGGCLSAPSAPPAAPATKAKGKACAVRSRIPGLRRCKLAPGPAA